MSENQYHRFIFTFAAIAYFVWGLISFYQISQFEPLVERAFISSYLMLFAIFSTKLKFNLPKNGYSLFPSVGLILTIFHFATIIYRSSGWEEQASVGYLISFPVVLMFAAFTVTSYMELSVWAASSILSSLLIYEHIGFVKPSLYLGLIIMIIVLAIIVYYYLDKLRSFINLQNEERIQNSNLVSIGKMSSILSHEVNNFLQFVNSMAFSLKFKDLIDDGKYNQIKTSSKSISSLLKNINTLSLKSESELDEINLKEKVNEILSLYGTRLAELDAKYKVDIPDDAILVVSNKDFSQCCLNLINNLIDHRKSNEELVFNIYLEEGSLVFEGNTKEILLDNLNRIFDPFITTKSVEQGVGLGLTITQKLLKNNGLDICCKNAKLGPAFYIFMGADK